jgi:hypothetical protein
VIFALRDHVSQAVGVAALGALLVGAL